MMYLSWSFIFPCFPNILGTHENNIPEKDPCLIAWKTFVRGYVVKTLKFFLEASSIREALQSNPDLDIAPKGGRKY